MKSRGLLLLENILKTYSNELEYLEEMDKFLDISSTKIKSRGNTEPKQIYNKQ
jgi:hypothetical protein